MEPWGSPALPGYSCQDFPFQDHKAKYLTWNSIKLCLCRRPACQTLSKAYDVSSATAPVASHLLKTLAILSDTTARRYTVDQEDLKPY